MLVAAAMRGDERALSLLWERNRRWIAAVLLAHKPSFEELEDLLQEVAVTFVTKVDTLREEAHLRAWLRVVAVNVARAAGRSGTVRRRIERPVRELPDVADGGAASADERERTGRLVRQLAQLPESYREPLMLRAVHGMRSRQIGEVLGLPPATVDTRIARARRMLREADAGAGPDHGIHDGRLRPSEVAYE